MRDHAQKNPVASRHCDKLVYGESNSRIRGACCGNNHGADEGWRWSNPLE
jgi:hypothetical protein